MKQKAHEAMDVANYIVNYCIDSGHPVSNLKLQKLLYYVVPAQAASRLGAVQGFSVLSLGLTSFFDFGDKKRPSTFRIVRPVNGLIFGICFSKLAGGEQHFMLFADGKSTRDSRFSGARGCSHLDGTK